MLKCARKGCIYNRHSNLSNNDGTYCCKLCKLYNKHGKMCEKHINNKGVELCLNPWYGRLGNNIHQLHNCILIGLYYNYNIRIPPHDFFSTTYIKLHNLPITETITDKGNFFFNRSEIKNIDKKLFSVNIKKSLDILRDCFIIKGDSILPLDDNDLVIHIRSGDIFSTCINKYYWQPPLSFYVNFINKNEFKNIYLVSEDNSNPCVDKLLELFPNIQYKQNTLEDDIKIILAAKIIISSNGWFVDELVKMSYNIKYVHNYSNEWFIDELVKMSYNVEHVYNCSNQTYIDFVTPWENTSEQRNIMLTFDENKPNNGL